MKILLLNDSFSHEGGTESYILALAEGLIKAKHEVSLVVGSAKETLPDYGLLVPNLESARLVSLIKDQKFDIAYFQTVERDDLYDKLPPLLPCFRLLHDTASICKYHFRSNEVCSEKLSLNHCLKSAWTEQSMTKDPLKIVEQVAKRQLILSKLNLLHKVFVNSHFTKTSYIREKVRPELIEVLPLFPTVIPTSNVVPERDKNIVIFSGRIFREKGIEYLIKAFSQVRESAELWIVGEGWELESSKELVTSLSLDKWVKFFGFVDKKKLKELYSEASIGVVPSIWDEPFGLSGIEMMSFGIPVVGFDSGGISEWLKSNENGFLVARSDWEELAAKINILILDKEKRLALGKKAQQFVTEHYNIAKHIGILENSFQEALKTAKA